MNIYSFSSLFCEVLLPCRAVSSLVLFITFHFSLCFTGDGVMVTIERAILKLVDPIQEFILRRLCGELQEVASQAGRSQSNYTDAPGG